MQIIIVCVCMCDTRKMQMKNAADFFLPENSAKIVAQSKCFTAFLFYSLLYKFFPMTNFFAVSKNVWKNLCKLLSFYNDIFYFKN